jgi:hypothetical protein
MAQPKAGWTADIIFLGRRNGQTEIPVILFVQMQKCYNALQKRFHSHGEKAALDYWFGQSIENGSDDWINNNMWTVVDWQSTTNSGISRHWEAEVWV